MCGRYGFTVKKAAEVYDRYKTANTLSDLSSRYNIAPGQLNPVIYLHGETIIERMFWGLIPYWAKDETMRYRTINARAESVRSAASFRKPFHTQRCLIPATGFYEWDKSLKPSQPYYYKMKDNRIFSFAGLYDIWKDTENGKEVKSYTIITTQANDLVGKIHNRMPVILHETDEKEWLNPDLTETEQLEHYLRPYTAAEMEAFPVSRSVNTPTFDSETLIRPIDSA